MDTSVKEERHGAYVDRIARGAGMSSFGQGVGRLLGYATQVAIARMYGPAQLGFYVLGIMLVQLANVFSQFGMDNGVVRYVAHYRTQGDAARVRGTILLALGVTFGLSLVISVLIFAGAGFLAGVVFGEPLLETIFRVFAVALPFFTLMSMALWATQGFQTVKYNTYVLQFARPLVNLGLVVLLYLLGAGVLGAAVAYTISMVIGSVLALFYLKRLFPGLTDRATKPRFESRALFSVSGPMTIAGFSSHINSWTVVTVLGIFSTASSVGVFNAAARTAGLCILVLVAFNGIFSPMISSLHGRGLTEDLNNLYADVSRWAFTGALGLFLITTLLSKDIMSIFGAEEFVAAWPVVVTIAAAQLFSSSVGPTARMLAMTGHQRVVAVATLSAAFFGPAASVALIPAYGILGATVATAGGNVLINAITLTGVRRRLGFWPYDRRYLKPILAGLIAGAAILTMKLALPLPSGIPTILLLSPVFGAFFVGMLLALGLNPSDRRLLCSLWAAVRRTMRGGA